MIQRRKAHLRDKAEHSKSVSKGLAKFCVICGRKKGKQKKKIRYICGKQKTTAKKRSPGHFRGSSINFI
jgi:hypothetical protein